MSISFPKVVQFTKILLYITHWQYINYMYRTFEVLKVLCNYLNLDIDPEICFITNLKKSYFLHKFATQNLQNMS